MADPWGTGYKNGHLAKGVANGWMSCATVKDTSPAQIVWREDKGDQTWSSEPSEVGTIADGYSKACHCLLDGAAVVVTNGTEYIWRSESYGAPGSWTVIKQP